MAKEPTIRDEIVLPLHKETISIDKQRVITGKVRVSTVTREREELVEEFFSREDVEIERKPVGKSVARPPAVRRTGDTIIIPIVEEVLAVVRRLVVKEEVRIRLVNRKEKHKQRVAVRSQEAVIDRLPAATRGPPPSPSARSQTEPTNNQRPQNR